MRTTTGCLLFYLIIHTIVASAQDSLQGIYQSAENFRQNKISFSPAPHSKYKIVLNETFYKPCIKIISGDSIFKLQKDSIFAYRDKENTIYRFYDKTIYEILNPDEPILLYSLNTLGGYKNTQTVIKYFFSADAGAPLQTLSLWNLKKAFPNDTLFHELLDLYFKNDAELIAYDHFYNTYKLNRVFEFEKQLIRLNTTTIYEQN